MVPDTVIYPDLVLLVPDMAVSLGLVLPVPDMAVCRGPVLPVPDMVVSPALVLPVPDMVVCPAVAAVPTVPNTAVCSSPGRPNRMFCRRADSSSYSCMPFYFPPVQTGF